LKTSAVQDNNSYTTSTVTNRHRDKRQTQRKGFPVEVKIGVQNVAREIVVESKQSPEEIEALVTAALTDGGLLSLVDESGRRVIVPVATIGYVDLGAAKKGSVGFGTI
jgi:hypothetical protein